MRRFVLCAVAAAVVACSLGAALPGRAQSKDEQEIRALEDRFAAAVGAKDLDAIMKVYAPGNELFVFDLVPPRQYVGWDAYRKDWQDTLAMMPGPLMFAISDLSITTDGKLAWSHSIQRVHWTDKNGAVQEISVRVTDCYRKIDGKWLIVMEHVSVPVDLETGKPDLLSMP
jgi:uncharacterized protein (TIGR02246 family)